MSLSLGIIVCMITENFTYKIIFQTGNHYVMMKIIYTIGRVHALHY